MTDDEAKKLLDAAADYKGYAYIRGVGSRFPVYIVQGQSYIPIQIDYNLRELHELQDNWRRVQRKARKTS